MRQSIDVLNRQTSYQYDGLGRQVYALDALNRTTLTSYDDAKHQSTMQLANGGVTTTVYDLAGAVLSQTLTDPNATVLGKTTNVYDADGRLRQSSYPNGQSEYRLYDAAGRKVGDIDRNNYLTEYVYNLDNQLVKTIRYATAVNVGLIKDFNGKPLDVSVDAVRPASISTDDRCSWNIYDKAGRLTATVDAAGAVSRYSYDGLSRLTGVTQLATLANVASFLNGLPPANLADTIASSPDDRASRTLYDNDGKVLGKLDAEGYLTEYRYDGAGQLLETIAYSNAVPALKRNGSTVASMRPAFDAKDIHQHYFYNPQGQLVATVDGENYLTEIGYDRAGNVASRKRYAKAVSNPNAANLADLGKVADGDDHLTSYTYTATNKLLTETAPDGTITRYSYDANDNVIETRRALGTEDERATSTVLRDRAGRITNELTAEGAVALQAAVARAALPSEITAIWNSYGITHSYDQNGWRVSTVDQNKNRTLFYYDANGNLTQTINANGEVTQQDFNGFNQIKKTTQFAKRIALTDLAKLNGGQPDATLTTLLQGLASSDDRITTTSYNALGQIDDQVDAMGFHHKNVYNAFGELKETNLQKTKLSEYIKSTFQYDHRGLKTASTLFNDSNVVQQSTYDAFGRVTTQADGNANGIVIGYDRLGHAISRKAGSAGATTFSYDAFERVLTQTDGIGTGVMRYTYDTAKRSFTMTSSEGVVHTTIKNRHGETVSISDSDGNLTSYAYDKNGKLKSVTDRLGVQSSNTYDNAGLTKTTVDANGKVTRFDYDAANRVATKTFDPDGLNLITSYTYNAQGQVLTVTDPKNIVNVTEYYKSGLVKSIVQDRDGLKLTTSYEYDSRGNMSSKTDALGSTSYSNSEAEFVDSTLADNDGAHLAEFHRYDKANNLLLSAKGQNKGESGYLQSTRYAYNANNQKIWEVDAEGAVTGYTYDQDNRLIKTTHYANRSSLINSSTKWDQLFSATDIAGSFTADAAHDMTTRIVYDLDGRVYATIDATGTVTVNQGIDASGRVTISTTKTGQIDVNALALTATKADLKALFVAMSYANSERQVTYFDARGNASAILKAVNESGGDDQWQVVKQEFDGNGNLISRTGYSKLLISGAPTKDLAAWLSTASNTSSSDTRQRMVYDAANRLTATATAQGSSSDGKLIWAISSQSYDKNGNVVARRQLANTLTAADVNAASINAFIAGNTSAQDMQTRLRYDGANRLIASAVAQGSTNGVPPQTQWAITSQIYDIHGNVKSRTGYATLLTPSTLPADPNAADFNNWIAGVADIARDRTTRYAYDAVNRLVVSVDAVGAVTRYSYDALGNQIKSVLYATLTPVSGELAASYTPAANPADITTRTVFDNKNRPVFQIDGLGYVTEQRFDTLGNVVAKVRYMTAVNLATLGDTISITALKALLPTAADKMQIQRTVFDKAGRQRFTLDAMGAITEFRYDAFGRVQQSLAYQIRHDLSNSSTLEADLAQIVLQEASSAQVTSYTYDSQDNVLTRTDANKATVTYTYDALGRRLSMKNALGVVWTYTYDAAGHKLTETSPPVISGNGGATAVGITTAYAYDAFDHVIKRSDAAGSADERSTRFVFDAAGRLAYTIDPLGYVTEQRYSALGQVTATVQHAVALDVSALNSANTTVANIKTLLGADTKADRISRVVYDEAGRVFANIDALGYMTVYQTSDAAGRPLSQTTKLLSLDVLNLAANISKTDMLAQFNAASLAGSKRQRFSYDANGNLSNIFTAVAEPANGTEEWQVTTQSFDANGNVVSRTRYSKTLVSATPRNDLNAWLAQADTINASNSQERMRYDAANRLTVTASLRTYNGATSEWGFVRHDYDANGNLMQQRAMAKTL
ncbi:MAG: RHS repeat protein, partial [Burkholderiales bacterium]|nr:RHS repeat protein [Burkholderiales bacterium]